MDASQYVTCTAVDPAGLKIGTVLAVTDAQRGTGWLTIGTGVLGAHEVHVPLAGTALREGTVVVPYAKSSVMEAPTVTGWQTMTPEDSQRLSAHYANAATPEQLASRPDATGSPSTDTVAITRSEELMHVGVKRVVSQVVRVSKYLVTETVTRSFQVSHEEIRVDTFPANGGVLPTGTGHAADEDPGAGRGQRLELILHAEQLVVTKEVIPVERVRLIVADVVEVARIDESVRREVVELTGVDGAARPLSSKG